jgi:hypothetical protein
MKLDEVRAIDLTPFQLALVHMSTDTDETTSRKITLRAPATLSGAGRIEAALQRALQWKIRTFGPNCIRPAHRFLVVVIDRATGAELGPLDGYTDEILGEAREVVWASRNPERAAAINDSIWNTAKGQCAE